MMLKPSMRDNYRYILVRTVPNSVIYDGKELYLSLAEAVTSLFGDAFAAKAWVAVMNTTMEYAIIRCRRGTEPEIMAAIATVHCVTEQEVALHPLLISGTIITLRDKIEKIIPEWREEVIIRGGAEKTVLVDGFGRIDLKEKGINLQTPLYISELDKEE
jgi:ribonuclease P/MRP protein subunit POP5